MTPPRGPFIDVPCYVRTRPFSPSKEQPDEEVVDAKSELSMQIQTADGLFAEALCNLEKAGQEKEDPNEKDVSTVIDGLQRIWIEQNPNSVEEKREAFAKIADEIKSLFGDGGNRSEITKMPNKRERKAMERKQRSSEVS